MPNVDGFKAAFMGKGKLAKKLGVRVGTTLQAIDRARAKLAGLPATNAVRQRYEAAVTQREQQMGVEIALGTTDAGRAWRNMGPIEADTTALANEIDGAVNAEKGLLDERTRRMNTRLEETYGHLDNARKARREVVNGPSAQSLGQAIDQLDGQVRALAAQHAGNPESHQQGYNLLEPLLTAAKDLADRADAERTTPAEPGSPRAATRATVNTLTAAVPAITARLAPNPPTPESLVAQARLAAELEVFDDRFARDPGQDPDAGAKNTAMRVAAVINRTADAIAREHNDPALKGRIAKALLEEYERDMARALGDAQGGDRRARIAARREAEGSMRLAKAMVMDDPVTKLMTGKITAPDAVQRVRDMAEAAGVKPSEMLELLHEQFDMQMGSLTTSQVSSDEKSNDSGLNFVLKDLYGELSRDQFTNIVALTSKHGRVNSRDAMPDRPEWRNDGHLDLRAQGAQAHRVTVGDTLATLAQTYLGDPARAGEIAALNKSVLVPLDKPTAQQRHREVRIDPGQPTAALPVGAVMMVPAQSSPLDQLAPYVAAFDVIEVEPQGVKPRGDTPPEVSPVPPEGLVRPTPEQLRTGASALKSPRDTNRNPEDTRAFVPAPGLNQNHRVQGPLTDPDAEGRAERVKRRQERIDLLTIIADELDVLAVNGTDSPAFKLRKAEFDTLVEEDERDRNVERRERLQGAINERQYAHLRLLQRGDEEDRENFQRENGESVEDWVLAQLAARYSVDAVGARGLLDDAVTAIGKVPLTITFKAESLFSDPTKDDPAHGAEYMSEVVFSRGREQMGDLIGRGENVEETVGVTGGVKTGWQNDRGPNYMRWRVEKDSREGRRDVLVPEDQQIFGAANPNFNELKGGAMGGRTGQGYGVNYYGDAHFLLRDSVRQRVAFAVRGAGISIGGGKSAVQRKDLLMVVYDMLKGGAPNTRYLDTLLLHAKGNPRVLITGLDWEVHIYGGFDIRKDAQAMYVKPDLDNETATRIQRFCNTHGVAYQSYGDRPPALVVEPLSAPVTVDLDA